MPTLREQALISLAVANVYAIIQIWIVAVPAALFGFWCLRLDKNKLEIKYLCDGSLYLTRWQLFKCKWFRVLLHQIHKADKDRHLHNHPWPWAVSLVLRGGYREISNPALLSCTLNHKEHNAPTLNVLNGLMYHRITEVRPNTFTLFIAGPRSKDWGFNVDGEHVPSRTYLGLPPDHSFGD